MFGPDVLPRAALAAVGLAVLLRGARLYRPTLALSAFGTGSLAVVALAPEHAAPLHVAVGAAVAGVVSVGLVTFAHRAGLAVLGAVVGGVVAFALGLTIGVAPFSMVGGALLGAGLFPFVYERALPLTTPAVGAVMVAAALDRADNLLVLGVLYAVGIAAQMFSGGKDA